MQKQQTKPSKAQRAAQSQRDKALAKQQGNRRQLETDLILQKRPVQGRRGGASSNARVPRSRKGFSGDRPMTSAAAAYSTGQHSQAPMITASRDQSRIVHRELIASVVGSANFAVEFTFALNPGQAASFPWLSTQAVGWESYRFNKLRFCAYTRTGSNVPGSLMLVPDYDASDAAPASEQVASSYEDVEEDVPWKDICCELRPASLHALGPRKFIRTGALPANADVKTYDAGNLFVCTTDGTAVNWSKLWVEYDVTLFTPQLPPGGAAIALSEHIKGTTPTTALPFANSVVQGGSSALVTTVGNVMTFLVAGLFLVNQFLVAGTSVTSAGVAPAAGAALVASFLNVGQEAAGSTTGNFNRTLVVQTSVGGTLTFTDTIVAGTSSEEIIALLPSTQT